MKSKYYNNEAESIDTTYTEHAAATAIINARRKRLITPKPVNKEEE